VSLIEANGMELPLVVVTKDEENVVKSFRNIDKVVVTSPGELEVTALVWARSVLVTQDALDLVKAKASS
jgi:ribosomal protein L4